jgi:hypothetical protein
MIFLIPLVAGVAYGQQTPLQTVEQYNLRVTSTPNIIFIPGGGFYNDGEIAFFEKPPAVWQDYEFIGWKVDGVWALTETLEIRMDKSHSVEAVFEKRTTGNIKIDSIPRVAEIIVDGEIYLPDEMPLELKWEQGSEHILSVPDVVKDETNKRYKFDSWKDNNGDIFRRILISDNNIKEFVALYQTQYLLKTISNQGTIIGGGWHDEGTSVDFKAEYDIVYDKQDDKVRYVFDSWDLGDHLTSAENRIDITEATTVNANWNKEFKLDLISKVPNYDMLGSGWIAEGKEISLVAENIIESEDESERYVFDRWVSRGSNPAAIQNPQTPFATITMDKPYVIEALYKKSYKVNVYTPYGDASGSGFYKDGETAEIRIFRNEVEIYPDKEKVIFNGWNTNGAERVSFSISEPVEGEEIKEENNFANLLIKVDRPTDVVANWKTQYYLDIVSTDGSVTGSGWYDEDTNAPVLLKDTIIPQDFWTTTIFTGWSGDASGEGDRIAINMNKPKTVIAEWKDDDSTGINNIMILVGAGVAGAIVFVKSRKNKIVARFRKGGKPIEYEQNPFEKYEERSIDYQYQNPMQKPKKKMILNWLMGKRN